MVLVEVEIEEFWPYWDTNLPILVVLELLDDDDEGRVPMFISPLFAFKFKLRELPKL